MLLGAEIFPFVRWQWLDLLLAVTEFLEPFQHIDASDVMRTLSRRHRIIICNDSISSNRA
jgi:hypothetical protein